MRALAFALATVLTFTVLAARADIAAPPADSGQTLTLRRTPVMSDYRVGERDAWLSVRASVTVSLPMATTLYGRVLVVSDETPDCGRVTVTAWPSETVGGKPRIALARCGTAVIASTGKGWTVLSREAPQP